MKGHDDVIWEILTSNRDIKGDIIYGISWKFHDFAMKWDILPSGKQTVCYWSHGPVESSLIYPAIKWWICPYSYVTVYQRVIDWQMDIVIKIHETRLRYMKWDILPYLNQEINGNFRILKWRYCTIFLAIFCGDIHLHRPYIGLIYGRYLHFRILKFPLKKSPHFHGEKHLPAVQKIVVADLRIPLELKSLQSAQPGLEKKVLQADLWIHWG